MPHHKRIGECDGSALILAAFEKFVLGGWPEGSCVGPQDWRMFAVMIGGCGGEAGEVQEHLKKWARDGKDPRIDGKLLLELGDALHYLTRIALYFDYSLEEVIDANVMKLTERRIHGK